VEYVRSRTGLPGGPATAAGYNEAKMRSFGYHKVAPRAGAILVWDAYQKGARAQGHMALIRSARYDNPSRKWIISVDQSNWSTSCAISANYTFVWGDLYGVNAYSR
jgi:hypothetical protein